MRIASVLHDASPEPDGAPLFPAVALERDGALYRVSELARAFGPRYAALADLDFRPAALALHGGLLHELDERLKSGERPSAARLLPGTFTWMPPCDTERAACFVCLPADGRSGSNADVGSVSNADGRSGSNVDVGSVSNADASPPDFRVATARTFLGHDATVPLPPPADDVQIECALAAVLADDLRCATASEAEHAILGYTVCIALAPGFQALLGPVIVTRDEIGALLPLRTQLRIGGAPLSTGDTASGAPFSLPESIAWISHQIPLVAGDVIRAARVPGARLPEPGAKLTSGARVELIIERIGRLAGRLALGPEIGAWRLCGERGQTKT